jgi:hypothetical protein
MLSSGIWRLIDLVGNDISEEHIASIFRVEKSAREEPARAGGAISQKTAFFKINTGFLNMTNGYISKVRHYEL